MVLPFPTNSLSPVKIDWAAEAVDSDIIALVGKSTSKQNTGYCLEGELRLAALESHPVQDLLRRKQIEPQAFGYKASKR